MNVREKLVKQAISHFWYGVSHDIFSEPVTTYAKLAIDALKKENGVTVQEWISVDDELPETGGYVVCIAKRNPFSRFMPMVARIEKNGWANPITEQYISEVTHWMPMPNPPKGE